jgi:hypothetical protein
MHLVDSSVDRDGKRAWCQVRPARRRVHGWAMPTRSRPERCTPAAQLVRSAPRCSCGDGLSASFDAWLHLRDALLLERCGRTSPAAHGTLVMRWAVCREKLGGCLRSARAGQRPSSGYIAKVTHLKRSVPYTAPSTSLFAREQAVGAGSLPRATRRGIRHGHGRAFPFACPFVHRCFEFLDIM